MRPNLITRSGVRETSRFPARRESGPPVIRMITPFLTVVLYSPNVVIADDARFTPHHRVSGLVQRPGVHLRSAKRTVRFRVEPAVTQPASPQTRT
jgi:hypothetical protein